jgi:indolepyruvate ferredoxin oxidoreductase
VRSRRRRYTLPHLALDKLPEPEWRHELTEATPLWRAHMSGVGGMGIGLVSAILVRAGHKQGYRVVFNDRKGLAIRNGGVFSQITFVNSDAATERRSDEGGGTQARRGAGGIEAGTGAEGVDGAPAHIENRKSEIDNAASPHIPYGQADLLLGIDVLEAARAVDPRADYRIATPGKTVAVLNTYKQATIESLMGRTDFDPQALRDAVLKHCNAEASYTNDLSALCERRLGSKQFVNIMMLGVAFQLGLIPVSAHSIAWAIKDSVKREHRRNLKAFNIGRKLALEPRALPPRPEPVTWEQFITSKLRIMRRDRYYSLKQASLFERLAHIGVRHLKNLSDRSKYDLVVRIYDLLQHSGPAAAKQYIDLLEALYRKDSFDCRHAATHTAIHNLAKVMLIKDEPYVAYLLTRPEKLQKDIEKYNVDVANGDRVLYEHYTSPELGWGKYRFRLKLKTRNWQLRLVRHMRFLRQLPGWHGREVAFRDWYISLLDKVDLTTPTLYDRTLAALRCPENVSGYREIRYPKMESARKEVEALLAPATAAAASAAPAPAVQNAVK